MQRPFAIAGAAALAALVAFAVACSGTSSPSFAGAGGGGSGGGGSSSGGAIPPLGSLVQDGGVGLEEDGAVLVLPPNFVATEQGGYALGPPVSAGGLDAGNVQNGASQNCALVVGVVRDFLSYGRQDGGEPDFEHFSGSGPTLGLVQSALGADQKPIYGSECDNAEVSPSRRATTGSR